MASIRSEVKLESMEKAAMGLHKNLSQVQGRLDKIDKAVEGLWSLKEMMEQLIKGQGGSSVINDTSGGHPEVGGEKPQNYEYSEATGRRREVVDDEVRIALKKIELPGFEGEDPLGWLGKMEQYFEVHETPQECRLK